MWVDELQTFDHLFLVGFQAYLKGVENPSGVKFNLKPVGAFTQVDRLNNKTFQMGELNDWYTWVPLTSACAHTHTHMFVHRQFTYYSIVNSSSTLAGWAGKLETMEWYNPTLKW